MTTLILIRHARSTANATGVLAGRAPGVHLDHEGREQAARVGSSLAQVPLTCVISSPLERCQETAQAVVVEQANLTASDIITEPGFVECDYGSWTSRPLRDLGDEPQWKIMQQCPSRAVFPDGEAALHMYQRAVSTALRWNDEVRERHGEDAHWAVVTHGDIVKSVVAHAVGLPFDAFQNLVVSTAAVSIIRYTSSGQQLLGYNHVGPEPLSAFATTRSVTTPTVGGES